jgi:hypothetical protein
MRVYPHWFVRYFGLVATVMVSVVTAFNVISLDLRGFALLALAVILLTFSVRAAVGGVEVTDTDYVVRNLFRTQRIPRDQVTGFTSVTVLWSIQWVTVDGDERFMPLSWFSDDAPRPIRRYKTRTFEVLRALAAGTPPA